MFLDNLDSQTRPSFKKAMKEAAASNVHYLTAGATDEIQVIDGGIGKEVKREMEVLTEKKLLEDRVFADQWAAGMSAMEKRIFLTHCGYEAHQNVMSRFDVEKVALRTGCAMTINGQNDEGIKPQGLPQYSFSPADADLPVQNYKGDFNDVDDEVGVIGEGGEVVEESADDVDDEVGVIGEGEEVRESEEEEEEEEILLVSNILSCQCTRNGTIKYICQCSGHAPEDTSLEPASMIQPKQVLLDFQERARADGSFPPSKPSPKRKKAAPKAKGAPRGRTKAASAGPSRASKRTRGSSGPPKSWNPERLYPSDEDESEEDVASLFKMPKWDRKLPKNVAAGETDGGAAPAEEIDLLDSDASPLKAPKLVASICDFGCPNPEDCIAPELTGSFCGAPGCSKQVHHLCLINIADNPKKHLWHKKFVDQWPSSKMCKRHCVQRVAVAEKGGKM